MKVQSLTAMAFAAALASGCESFPDNMPLVFGQTQTVGISIAGSAANQGASLAVGYDDRNLAIVPITTRQSDGHTQLLGTVDGAQDALSTFGQFSVQAGAGTQDVPGAPTASLGKFFATGLAAQKLADGFACSMGATGKCQ